MRMFDNWLLGARATKLVEAIRAQDVTKVQDLLKGNPRLASAYDGDGIPALWWAAGHGNLGIVSELLSHVADVNTATRDGWTPLHEAAKANHPTIVALLLSKGADANAKASNGRTPIFWPVMGGYGAAAALKLAPIKTVYVLEGLGNAYEDVVELLLRNGADPNAQEEGGTTPLHYAVFGNNVGIVRLLMKWGADPNHAVALPLQMGRRGSLFQYATLHKYEETANVLRECGAAPEIVIPS